MAATRAAGWSAFATIFTASRDLGPRAWTHSSSTLKPSASKELLMPSDTTTSAAKSRRTFPDATADPGDLNVLAVKHVGHLIRELHDALSTFPLPPTAIWNVAIKPHSTKLICHNDLASWNFVRRTGSTTFIDRDGAGPGSRLWDLAYAAHGFIPLSTRSGLHDTELPERLAALVDGCGLDERERLSLVNLLAPRINSMDQLLHRSWVEGVDPWRTLWSEGHGDAWREDHEFVVTRLNWWMSPCVAIPRLLLDQISHKH